MLLFLIRPGSVGVTSQLIFQNQSVVPNITDVADSLKQTINESIVYLNVITSSIYAGECYNFCFMCYLEKCLLRINIRYNIFSLNVLNTALYYLLFKREIKKKTIIYK